MTKTFNVFVYGTLRKHESNHRLIEDAACIAEQAWVYGSLYDTGVGYPAMVASSDGRVYGEIYEVSEEQLTQLDWLEGYSGEGEENYYDRVVGKVHTDSGPLDAYIYTFQPDQINGLHRIAFDDWKCHQHLEEKELLYFAYGSCMDMERFSTHNVAHLFSDVKGCGITQNYQLAFTRRSRDGGRADMVEGKGWVEGKVYHINQQALTYLYRREGVEAQIYRPAFLDIDINGVHHTDVLTFLVIDKEEEIAPPLHYAKEIIRGAKGNVSESYREKLEADLYSKFQLKIMI